MRTRIAYAATVLLILTAATFAQRATTDTQPPEKSVRPGINRNYLDPDIDVEDFVARFEVESREVCRARHEIVAACQLEPGDRVADIGAGTGLFVTPLIDVVGAEGWLFAVDIAPRFLERIGQLAQDNGYTNVTPILGGQRNPRLAPDSVDCVLICDVYHHFEFPLTTMRAVHAALRPGGRLIVVDFERIQGVSRDFILGHVRAGKEVFRKEIQAAGFEFIAEREVAGLKENYCLEFRKPVNGGA